MLLIRDITKSTIPPISWQPVLDEIKGRISKYMSEENSINRRVVVDHRIHCCVYFLSPFASGLVFFYIAPQIYRTAY